MEVEAGKKVGSIKGGEEKRGVGREDGPGAGNGGRMMWR